MAQQLAQAGQNVQQAGQGLFLSLRPPQLTLGTNAKQVRKFLEEWKIYENKFVARQADGSLSQQAQKERMLDNIDTELKYHIWKWELGKANETDLTEAELKTHLESKLSDLETHVPLEKIIGYIKFDSREYEPAEKVGKYFRQVDKALKRHNAVSKFSEKAINKIMVEAIVPQTLKLRVKDFQETTEGHAAMKTRMAMYKELIKFYKSWYEMHPTGQEDKPAAQGATRTVVTRGGRGRGAPARSPTSVASGGQTNFKYTTT